MIKNYYNIAKKNIKNKKVRSILTILGVVIGVASIIALVSVSSGLEKGIVKQFEKIGSDRLFIFAKGGGTPGMSDGLNTRDFEVLEGMSEFEYVSPYVFDMAAKVEYSNRERNVFVYGWLTEKTQKKWEDYDLGTREGRLFYDGERNVAVLGHLAAEDLFSKEIPVGSKIEIEGEKFQVIGILEEIGNSQDDNQIMISLDDAREIFNKPTEINAMDAKVKAGQDMDTVVARTKRNLERVRDKESFEVQTPTDILKFLNDILLIVKSVLISIAAISLVVGSIGIMNSMYTSVLERTKEIGIMKSIGASDKNIMHLFLVESGIIGLVGGVLGVILGFALSFGIGAAAEQAGFKMLFIEFDITLAIAGLLFAIGIGLISGYLPAKQAAKLKIVEALRYD